MCHVAMFKPQPILPSSSDTPPEDDSATWHDIPPPPSERKIARRRPSMKQKVVHSTSTTAPNGAARARDDDLVESLQSDDNMDPGLSSPHAGPSNGPIEFLSFAATGRTRMPGPRPSSPPHRSKFNPEPLPSNSAVHDGVSAMENVAGPSAPKRSGSMGPPVSVIRKTRKSMKGFVLEFEETTRKESLIIPLPESETPMIRKNKALREEQRRSSLGSRGQRASSSLGKGEISKSPFFTSLSLLSSMRVSSWLI